MSVAALENQAMEQRRTLALLLAIVLCGTTAGASLPLWVSDLAASAAWILAVWLAVSAVAAAVAVRWFRRRAGANELMTLEEREVELPGEPAPK